MSRTMSVCLLATALVTMSASAQSAADIHKGIANLRGLPDAQRGPRTGELAHQIAALPAGKDKASLALGLAHLSTEGDPGRDNLQAVTDTLAKSLEETPPAKGPLAGSPYMELADLVRFEGMSIPASTTENADYKLAMDELAKQDEQINKADFSLKDLNGKKWTLSELRGKIVMVNFWATWCPPCRQEFPQLDVIAAHFASQGLVILALTDEDGFKVNTMLAGAKPHFNILLDTGHKTANQFHVTGIPKTFVFDREGKLAAEAIDMRTQHQFLSMLSKAGLKP